MKLSKVFWFFFSKKNRFLACLLIPVSAFAADPPQHPYLRIEAGGHTGAVTHLATDAAGRLLATASFDKTIRLWSLPDGRPVATLRPPIGERQEGELYAVAMTPDGARVFAGGATCGTWDAGFCIYIFDTNRRTLLGLLPNLPAPVNDLAVSPDGARFAAGLAQGGIRVFDARSGAAVFEDSAYGGPVRAVAFDAQGRLFTTSADGHVRAYDATGRRIGDAQPEPGLHPWALAVSPDSFFIAVGYDTADKQGHPHLDVLNAGTLNRAFAPDMSGLHADGLLAVGWMADASGGSRLLAGGYLHDERGTILRAWGDFGLGAATDLAAAGDTIRAILPLPGGGAAYASEDPGWGRIDTGLHVAARPEPPLLDLRPSRGTLAIAPDGHAVSFASSDATWRFDATTGTLSQQGTAGGDLRGPRIEAPGVAIANWQDTAQPSVNGTRLALDRGEFSRSLTILADGRILLGTDNALRLYDKTGHPVAQVAVPEPAIAVTAGDGVIAAALLDGTIRWYGDDLTERAALFVHRDGQRWVLFTPDGLFDDASAGGDTLVGVQLNRARNQAPDWLSFSQAFRALYDPASTRAALRGDASAAAKRMADLGDLRGRLSKQPLVEITSACLPRADGGCVAISTKPGAKPVLPAEAGTLRLTLKLTNRGLGFGNLDSFVNDRNAGRQETPSDGASIDVPLDPGENSVQLRLYDHGGTLFSQTPRLELGSAQNASGERGRLFILAVGIDHYASPDLTLHYAVADAKTFTQTLKEAAEPLYHGVVVISLTDGQATRLGILGVLDELSREVKPTDTFLFYVASHGARSDTDGRFLLIPADESDLSSWAAIARGAIDEPSLIAALSRIQARDALLFLDTCHSGEMSADTLANLGHETGRYLLAASSPVQEALDSVDDHNGPLVFALREALSGRAATGPDGTVSALALGEYVSRRVGELAREKGHEQDAQFKTAQTELRSFPIGRVSK